MQQPQQQKHATGAVGAGQRPVCDPELIVKTSQAYIFLFYFEGFTSIPTAVTANDRNRRIQVYQASDG